MQTLKIIHFVFITNLFYISLFSSFAKRAFLLTKPLFFTVTLKGQYTNHSRYKLFWSLIQHFDFSRQLTVHVYINCFWKLLNVITMTPTISLNLCLPIFSVRKYYLIQYTCYERHKPLHWPWSSSLHEPLFYTLTGAWFLRVECGSRNGICTLCRVLIVPLIINGHAYKPSSNFFQQNIGQC